MIELADGNFLGRRDIHWRTIHATKKRGRIVVLLRQYLELLPPDALASRHIGETANTDDNKQLAKIQRQLTTKEQLIMAPAKKAAPKAATTPKKTATQVKVSKPAAKAPAKKAAVSKTAQAIARITANIAKLTERKDKISADIQTLRDQRLALKAAPVPAVAAPAKPKAKTAPKASAKAAASAKSAVPAKAAKPAIKKK